MCEALQAVCYLFLFLCFPLLFFFIHPFLVFFILLVHPYCSRYECKAEAGCYDQVHCAVCQPVQYGCYQYQQQIACGCIDSFHDSMILSLVPSLFSQTGIAMSNHLCSWLMSFSFLNFLKQLCLHLYQHAKLFILNSFAKSSVAFYQVYQSAYMFKLGFNVLKGVFCKIHTDYFKG
nr:MAG TPA: hypothetical protein [Caudoviricetes sp.]